MTTVQTCNGVNTQSSFAPQRMVYSGAATGSWAFSQAKNTTKNFEFYSDAGYPSSTSWASGNWVVQVNVTTASSVADTWVDTCIIRVNSSGAAQATVGSLTGQSVALTTTGVKSMTVSGAAQSAAASDRIVVVLNFKTANVSPTNHTWTIDAGNATNDVVTTPVAVNFSGSATETNSTSDSTASLQGLARGDTETVSASDSLARVHGLLASLTETQSSADLLARSAAFGRSGSETESSSDLLARSAAFGRSQGETNSTNDSLARLAGLHRGDVETQSASDALGRSAGFRAAPSVTLTASDALAGQRGSSGAASYTAGLSEIVTHSDALLRQAGWKVGLAQSLSLAVNLNALRNVKRSFSSGSRVLGGKSSGRQTTFKSAPKH